MIKGGGTDADDLVVDDTHPFDEPYAVTLAPPTASMTAPAVVRASWVPVAALLFAAPGMWALLLVVRGLSSTTYPDNTAADQIFGDLAALVGLALLGVLVALTWGVLRRSSLAWHLAVGFCGLVVATSLVVLAGGGWTPSLVAIWGSSGACHVAAGWLLLSPRTRREFTHQLDLDEQTRRDLISQTPEGSPQPARLLESEPSERPVTIADVPRAASSLWNSLGNGAPKLLFGAAVLFAVAAGSADKVTGSVVGQNVQHTRASLAFMGIALLLGLAAAVVARIRRNGS